MPKNWQLSTGMGGNFGPEWWQLSNGIGGNFAPEYALKQLQYKSPADTAKKS